METTANLHDEYISLKTRREELTAQRARIEEKEKGYSSEIKSSEFRIEQAQKKLLSDEKRFIRDDITEKELKATRTQVNDITQKLDEIKRLQELSAAALPDIDDEIRAINQKISTVQNRYCSNIKNELVGSIDKNQEIRTKLLEAFGATLAAHNLHEPRWHFFIGEIFKEPNREEINKAVADFRTNHKL